MEFFKLQGFERFKSDYCYKKNKRLIDLKDYEDVFYENFIDDEIHVDGDALQKLFFPTDVKYDVFISHSHSDIELAKEIAADLENKYGIKCFIDSEVWLFYKDIVKVLTALFQEHDKEGIVTDAHILLVESLFRVLINTDVFFFLETKNSIDYINNKTTYSPWLFFELSLAKHLNDLQGHILLTESKTRTKISFLNYLKVDFKTYLSNLITINREEWISEELGQERIRRIYKQNAFKNIIYNLKKKNN